MALTDDSISFSKEQLSEYDKTVNSISNSITLQNASILSDLNIIAQNWEGDIKDTAEPDFQQVKDASDGISSNLKTISSIMSDKAENFAKVKFE